MLSLSLTASLVAQVTCPFFGDDGLAPSQPNQCCNPVVPPPLPPFPDFSTTGTWLTRVACQTFQTCTVNVTIQAPVPFLCTAYVIGITVTPVSPGAPSFSGSLVATYSSTWPEQRRTPPPMDFLGQVWRFQISGDVTWLPSGYPSPDGAQATIHLTGAIDYSCGDDGFNNPMGFIRYDLHHLCDCLEHPAGGARPAPPGGYHPLRDFHLVGPNPVVVNPTNISFPNQCFAPGNGYLNGSIREFDPVLNICYRESLPCFSLNLCGAGTLTGGAISFCFPLVGGRICPCTGGASSLWQTGTFAVVDFCNGVAQQFSAPPANPCGTNQGAVESFICRHPNPTGGSPGVFPAGRDVYSWFIRADMQPFNGGICSPTTVSTTQKEVITGVSTTYLAGSPFQAWDFNPAPFAIPPVCTPLTGSQSDWMNHHVVLDTGQHVPTFGVPTVGTLIMSGLN